MTIVYSWGEQIMNIRKRMYRSGCCCPARPKTILNDLERTIMSVRVCAEAGLTK